MGIGNIANTGMRAAMSDMEIISNNIANANTIGYKRSFGTFGDIYPSSSGGSTLQTGLGVSLIGVQQDFTRGGAIYTNNQLDMMIGNDGFFVTKDANNGTVSYTRAGRFGRDPDGYLTNGKQRLQGFPATNGVLQATGMLTDLQITDTPRNAAATRNVSENVNLDARAKAISAPFNVNDTSTYNYMTTVNMYDSLGNSHTLSTYYVKTADNTWTVNALVDGTQIGTGTMTFNSDGTLASATGLNSLSFNPGAGAASPQAFAISVANSTQYATDNSQRPVSKPQDGYPVGKLSNYEIDGDGNLIASYSNQERVLLGKVAIAKFQSPGGLQSIGNMSWVQSSASGSPIIDASNSNKNITAGEVETSNVDLTQEMISLISAQHNFQANAQVEQTYNETIQQVIKM